MPLPLLFATVGVLAIGTIYFVWARKVDSGKVAAAEKKAEQK